jgi:hypothetical protein
MSHFSRIKTKLSDGDLVEETLRELGLQFSRNNEKIRGWMGGTMTAEFRITTGVSNYDVGLRRNGNAYEVVADWSFVRGLSRDALVSDLNRTYALLGTKKMLDTQGFTLSKEVRQADGSTKLVLKKKEFVVS